MILREIGGRQRVLVATRALSLVGRNAVLLFIMPAHIGAWGRVGAYTEAEAKMEAGANREELK